MSRTVEVGERIAVNVLPSRTAAPLPSMTAAPLPSMTAATLPQPLARINAPTPKNVAIFLLSLLPWPTAIAIAVAVLTQRLDWRVWAGLAAGWSAVEFAIRNPHQVTLERQAAGANGLRGYDLDVRSWWLLLVRTRGKTVALGPDSRLVRNVGVIDCSTGRLVELRIYRWQFKELVGAFRAAGYEVRDECSHTPSRWRARAPFLAIPLVAAMAVAAVALVEIHGF